MGGGPKAVWRAGGIVKAHASQESPSESAGALFSGIPTVCVGCGETFDVQRRDQMCCSARCRAKAAKARRTARLLECALAVADYLPAAGQAAYDALLREIVS